MSSKHTVDLTAENFEKTVEQNDIVILDFWAPWCRPCLAFAPTFEAAAAKNEGVVFAKVNTEAEPGLAQTFSIQAIPTLMVFRSGIIVFSQPGMLRASELDRLVEQVKLLDMDKVRADVAAAQKDAPPAT